MYNGDMPLGRPSSHPRSQLGERITAARTKAGITQAQLAEKLGVTQRLVAHWERRLVSLKPVHLAALCDTLGVTASHLLGQPEEEPAATRQTGPVGKMRTVFDEVSKLPRRQQDKIIGVVEALLAQSKAA